MEKEKLQILQMLQDGKISADEAGRLLAAIDEPRIATPGSSGAKWFRVRITDIETGRAKVNVNLPMALLDAGLNIGLKFIPEEVLGQAGNVDFKQLMDVIKQGAIGKLVEVEDEEEGIRIEITVE